MKASRVARAPYRSILSPHAALFSMVLWASTRALLPAVVRRDESAAVEALVGAVLIYAAARYALIARTRRAALGRLALAMTALSIASMVRAGSASSQDLMRLLEALARMPLPLIIPVAAVVVVWPALQAPSYDAEDRALSAMAVWTAVPAVLDDAIIVAVAPSVFGRIALLFAFFAGIPLVVAAAALLRSRSRRRWLSRIEAGREPGWSLVDSNEGAQADLPVLIGRPPDALQRFLARVSPSASTEPFRAMDRVEPVAIVRGRIESLASERSDRPGRVATVQGTDRDR